MVFCASTLKRQIQDFFLCGAEIKIKDLYIPGQYHTHEPYHQPWNHILEKNKLKHNKLQFIWTVRKNTELKVKILSQLCSDSTQDLNTGMTSMITHASWKMAFSIIN